MLTSKLLNLASGDKYTDGWVNVDLHPDYKVDFRASIFDMPFPDHWFEHVHMSHILEHIAIAPSPIHGAEGMTALFKEVTRVCEPGARVTVIGPCIRKALDTCQPRWLLRDVIESSDFGGPDGYGHAWTPTTERTLAVMRQYLDDVTEVKIETMTWPATPNTVTAHWQVAAEGRTPGG